MSSFHFEDLSHRLSWMRDEQTRTNATFESRIKELESENTEVRRRLTVLTRLLIAKQLATAEEIATALAVVPLPAQSGQEQAPVDAEQSPAERETPTTTDKL